MHPTTPGIECLYLVAADQLTRVPLSSRAYRGRPVPAAYYVDGYQKARAFIVTERPARPAPLTSSGGLPGSTASPASCSSAHCRYDAGIMTHCNPSINSHY